MGTDHVHCITAYADQNKDYEQEIEKAVTEFDYSSGELVIATDILGGSVNNEFSRFMGKYPFHLITGVNLVTVISLILNLQSLDTTRIQDLVDEVQGSICYCNVLESGPEQNDF